ncbi:MAG: SIR2 family protein [Acidobacteriota bacterium]|nr:SIR2 family protein [Acidobacteriota bacterium]
MPTDDERERGVKLPTAGHRGIARLVALGYIRVILTTNFDRLLEAALSEAGVNPVVVSSEAAAAGATPLAHSRITIVKLHGDYLEPDLKNTVEELSTYGPELNRLLDQVLDEYGLIVCGWSGEWDLALREALLRAPGRRYATYWTHVGPVSDLTSQLLAHRSAVSVPIDGADTFFDTLATRVELLHEASDQAPLSTALAVAAAKRYLPDPIQRIRLHDLIVPEANSVRALDTPVDSPHPTVETVTARMRLYEETSSRLVALLATITYFSDESRHDELVVESIGRLVEPRPPHYGTIYNVYEALLLYPATLAMYAVGIAGVATKRPAPIFQAFHALRVDRSNGQTEKLSSALASWRTLGNVAFEQIFGDRRKTPQSDYLHGVLRQPLSHVLMSDREFDTAFNEFEYMWGVLCAYEYGRGPIGRWVWSDRRSVENTLPERFGAAMLDAGLFEGDASNLQTALDNFKQQVNTSNLLW